MHLASGEYPSYWPQIPYMMKDTHEEFERVRNLVADKIGMTGKGTVVIPAGTTHLEMTVDYTKPQS